jgi:hypothetical protein
VHDKRQPETPRFVSTRDAAVRANYYTIDAENLPRDFVEDLLSKIEAVVMPIIAKICKDLALPDTSDLQELLYFVGTLFARGPAVRDHWAGQMGNLGRMIAKTTAAANTPDQLRAFFEDAGVDLNGIDPEDLRDFMAGDDNDISVSQEHQVAAILQQSSVLYQFLRERDWYVCYRTQNMSSKFVIGDCPVILSSTDPAQAGRPVGFGTTDTRVQLPLSSSVVLIGEYIDEPRPSVRCTNRVVRLQNSLQVVYAERFLFSEDEDFHIQRYGSKTTFLSAAAPENSNGRLELESSEE